MTALPAGIGEWAALATALLWSGGAHCFGAASRRVGADAVNHVRLPIALAILTALHVVVMGTVVPTGVAGRDVALFCASGVVGLTLGDAVGFRGLVLVGPAVVTLVMTSVPAIAALMAFAFLGEALTLPAIGAMALTMGGIALAVWGRVRGVPREAVAAASASVRHAAARRSDFAWGIAFSLGGAVGQAGGVVIAKPALAASAALSGTWIRMLAASLALWLFTAAWSAATRRRPSWWGAARTDGTALALSAAGALLGPSVGVWLSLVATKHASVAVATTLMAVVPVFVLLEEWAFAGRRPRATEAFGTAIAVAGVALLVSGW